MFDDDEDIKSYEEEESRYAPDPSDFEELHTRIDELNSDEFKDELESEVEESRRLIDENPSLLDEDSEEDEILKQLKGKTAEDFSRSIDSSGSGDVLSEKTDLAPPSEGSFDGIVEGEGSMPAIDNLDLISSEDLEELERLSKSGAQFDDIDGTYVQTGQGETNESQVGTESERRREAAFHRIKLNDDALRFVRNEGLSEFESDEVNALNSDIESSIFEREEAEADQASDRNIKASVAQGRGKSL